MGSLVCGYWIQMGYINWAIFCQINRPHSGCCQECHSCFFPMKILSPTKSIRNVSSPWKTRTVKSYRTLKFMLLEVATTTDDPFASSPVLSRFTSSSTCQPISFIILALIIHQSFTVSLQAENLPYQPILPTLDFLFLMDCLHDNEGITLIILFFVSHFNFLFIPCGRLSWYPSAFYFALNTH